MSLLSHHNTAVKSALVLTQMSPLFSFNDFVARSCGMLSCLAWQVHNRKSVSLPSWQIIQEKKVNCPCIICGHILLCSSSVLSLSYGLLSRAVRCFVCPSSGILSCHTRSQLSHKVWKFLCQNASVLWYVLFENHPPSEGNNNFFNSQIFGRVVKFGKCAI
jgi:hypothetical protein